MKKKITLLGIVILLFLLLAGCVGYAGYGDYDHSYGHTYGFDGSHYQGSHNYGYDHHGGHHDHDFDRDDR